MSVVSEDFRTGAHETPAVEQQSPEPHVGAQVRLRPGGWRNHVRHTQFVVFGDHYLTGIGTTSRAVGIAMNLKGPKALLEGVIGHQPSLKGLTQAEKDLHSFDALQRTDDPAQH